ncbi:MAG TPA: hypothetical protein VHT73_09495 [Thermodesulfobacteriota bacterium]|nr:hypothetical protein [Thermodesulfobacteriota bacterium]
MVVQYIVAWIPMILIAIANGALREFTYGKYLSELRAHQVSTLTAIVFFGVYIWAFTRIWRLESAAQALTIGIIWVGLTVAFEFMFGHYVMGNPWSRLLRDYNIFAGHVWILVLIWVGIAPWLFYHIQG